MILEKAGHAQRKKINMSNDNKVSEVRTTEREPGQGQRLLTFKASQLIWLVFGVLEVLLALRIGFMLVGANAGSPVVAMIYGITAVFLVPFVGLIGSPTVGGFVLEISSMFAMLIYALIGWVIDRLVWLIFYRPREPMIGVTKTTTSEHSETTP
jgi:hypothetical protein